MQKLTSSAHSQLSTSSGIFCNTSRENISVMDSSIAEYRRESAPDRKLIHLLDHTKPRRKVWGRAARTRRRKKIEIERNFLDIIKDGTLSRDSAAEVLNTVIPNDRNIVWPSVLERRSNSWCQTDEVALRNQLGYVPGNAINISCRVQDVQDLYPELNKLMMRQKSDVSSEEVSQSVPVAVQLYPLAVRGDNAATTTIESTKAHDANPILDDNRNQTDRENIVKMQHEYGENQCNNSEVTAESWQSDATIIALEPFPTIYWLTHPTLRTLISGLEVEGYGVIYSNLLSKDTLLLQRIQHAHSSYGKERYELLTESDRRLIEERRWQEVFNFHHRGIAGIRYTKQCSRKSKNAETFLPPVKCLHTHTAHYLSGCKDNVIGQWVMEELEKRVKQATAALLENPNAVGS